MSGFDLVLQDDSTYLWLARNGYEILSLLEEYIRFLWNKNTKHINIFLYQTSTKTNKIILHRCLAKYWFLHVCVYLRMFVNTADTSIPYFLEVRLPLLYHDFFPCLCIYSTVNLLSPEKLFGKGFLVTFPMGWKWKWIHVYWKRIHWKLLNWFLKCGVFKLHQKTSKDQRLFLFQRDS